MIRIQVNTFAATVGLLAASLFPAQADAQAIHAWSFEDDPGFLEDSVGDASLSEDGLVAETLPANGRGSEFSRLIPGNATAADAGGVSEHGLAELPDFFIADFTIEVLAHFDKLGGSEPHHVVGTAAGALNAATGWSLRYVPDDGTLQMTVCNRMFCEAADSGFSLKKGIDYYIAASFEIQDEDGGEIVFYLKDLTNDGGLRTSTVGHEKPVYNPVPQFTVGSTGTGTFPMDGLIDEVRFAKSVLPESELLISPICPKAPTPECRPLVKNGGSLIDINRDGKLKWQWKKGSATTKEDFGDPTASEEPTNYSVCIYDEVGGEPFRVGAFEALGGSGWKEKNKGFNYKVKGAGLTKMILKAGEDKNARLVDIKGKKLDMPALPLAQDPRVVVQLVHDEGGCWETEHSGPADKNGKKAFRDKAD